MKCAEYLTDKNIVLDLKGRTRDEIISELVDTICPRADNGKRKIMESIYAVEDKKDTAVGHGVAIPHGRTDVVPHIRVAFGRCGKEVHWGSQDGPPVRLVWLVINPHREADEYLNVLSEITKVSVRRNSREAIFKAKHPTEIIEVVKKSKCRSKPRN